MRDAAGVNGTAAPTPDRLGDLAVRHHPDGVTDVVIDRYARRNALSSQVLDSLTTVIGQCEELGQRLLVISGNRGIFSAGADLAELTGLPQDRELDAQVGAVAAKLASSRLVSIAAIEGACVGAGLELASACDLRVADGSAFFALPALNMGLLYRPAAVARLADLVGSAWVTRLMVLGERLTARQGYEYGLVTVLSDTSSAATASDLAANLSGKPPETLINTVRMIADTARDDHIYRWQTAHLNSFGSAERYNAVSARHAVRKEG
jgi:enoyl-CoA hydratase